MKTFKHLILTQQGDKFVAVANENTMPLAGIKGAYTKNLWIQSCQTFEVDIQDVLEISALLCTPINELNNLDCSTFLALNDDGKMVFYTGEEKAYNPINSIAGFTITVIESAIMKDGNPIMYMSPKDYKNYTDKLNPKQP